MTADPTPDPNEPANDPPADPPADPDPPAAKADDRLPDDHPVVKALNKANEEAKQARLKVKEFEDRDKTEDQKLKDRIAELEPSALEAARLRVALRKGLTESQAKRLVGTNEEEFAADADELLADLTPPGEDPPGRLPGKPTPRLRGGGNPTEEPEETDPRKLAANLPRH